MDGSVLHIDPFLTFLFIQLHYHNYLFFRTIYIYLESGFLNSNPAFFLCLLYQSWWKKC